VGNDTSWSIWAEFYISLSYDPFLSQVDDPILLLKIFTSRYRVGTLAPSGTTELTLHLRQTCSTLGNTLGIAPQDISICSLHSSSAMALLIADVDTNKIRLLGQWRSDEMLQYLHVQALPIIAPLADLMVHHGFYSLLPSITNRGYKGARVATTSYTVNSCNYKLHCEYLQLQVTLCARELGH